jgi:hypothetical protein
MGKHRDRVWWQQVISAWTCAVVGTREDGEQVGVSAASLYRWRSKLAVSEADSELSLLRVEVAELRPECTRPLTAVVGPATLRFEVGTDAGHVGEVVAAIARAVARC